jgi:hypothetical protein
LLERSLPRPRQDVASLLKVVEYYQNRNYVAYKAHRKRRFKELADWSTLQSSA